MPSPENRATGESRLFWDEAARRNAAWYVATGHRAETPDFFDQGGGEVDAFLSLCGIEPDHRHHVLEIGCGVGRMTWRLAERFGRVTAVDISQEMLDRCQKNLDRFDNVDYALVSGDGGLPGVAGGSQDAVFSYITLQHVPSAQSQGRYLAESARVLRPGGQLGIQVRAADPRSMLLEWLGHVVHSLQGRSTLSRSWRGQRLGAPDIRRILAPTVEGIEIRDWPHRRRFTPAHWWVVGTKHS